MFTNTTKSAPKSTVAPKSGLVPATLHAINPTPALYEKIVGRKLGYEVDYTPKEGKTPFRLLVSVNGEFIFMDMWDLQNKVRVSQAGKTQFIDSSNGKTTWRMTLEEAVKELGEGCSPCRIGEEDIVNIVLQYRGVILNSIIDKAAQFDTEVFNGNFSMFNDLLQSNFVDKKFYIFAYSKTSESGFVNLQALRGIFMAAWKIVDKHGNTPTWTDKDGNNTSNVIKTLQSVRESLDKSESLQKPNIFISLQLGFVTQGGETPIVSNFEIPEVDPNATDDLPF
jgi:hypothetical protein